MCNKFLGLLLEKCSWLHKSKAPFVEAVCDAAVSKKQTKFLWFVTSSKVLLW